MRERVNSNGRRPLGARIGGAVVSGGTGAAGFGFRRRVQLGVFLLTLAVGIQFAVYVHQAGGNGRVWVQRPPGVEGFLPIGALMGWKRLLTSGTWDHVHPAAMVILGFAAVVSFGLRKSFCGWFCPVGAPSEWLWRAGRRILGRNVLLPAWVDVPLRGLKYVLLGFFVWVVFRMGEQAIAGFLQSPYYKASDVKMLHFFTRMSPVAAWVMAFLVAASFFIRNFWCRYLCPYGALMNLLALLGPTRIRRDSEACIGCGRCARVCPYHLALDVNRFIRSAECSGCMDCVASCPVQGALACRTRWPVKWIWTPASMGAVIVFLFVSLVFTARITGHWQGRVDTAEMRILLKHLDAPFMTHPRVARP